MSQWHNGQCSHNLGRAQSHYLGRASTLVKILLRLHFQDWIGLRRRMCFCKISQNCRIMHNIAQLHNSAEYCTIAGFCTILQSCCCVQWFIIGNGLFYSTFHNCRCKDMQLGTIYSVPSPNWDNFKKQSTSHLIDKVQGPDQKIKYRCRKYFRAG